MRLSPSLAALCLVLTSVHAFNPYDFEPLKQTAHCKALNRKEGKVKDIDIRYVDVNDESSPERPTILMVHGWPSLWSSWSNQIEEFRNDYRLLAPDLRGFGNSTHPGDVKSSGTMGDMVGDLACVLENAGAKKALCMGHDWGSQLCYEAARMRPDLISAVIGVVVPYIPSAGPFVPISQLVPLLPKLTYQLYFDQRTSLAIKELNKDIRRTLRATLRTVASPPPEGYLTSDRDFLEAYKHLEEVDRIPFLSREEEDYFVEQYGIQVFKYNLQFYMHDNRHEGWKFANGQGNHTIPQHVLAVYPRNDPVASWTHAAALLKSASFIPNLTVKEMDGAHWPHLEFPSVFNEIVKEWLEAKEKEGVLFGKRGTVGEGRKGEAEAEGGKAGGAAHAHGEEGCGCAGEELEERRRKQKARKEEREQRAVDEL